MGGCKRCCTSSAGGSGYGLWLMDTIHIVGVVVQVEDLLVEAMEVEVEDIVVEEMEVELEDLLAEDMEVQLEVTHSNVYYFIFSSVNKQAKRLKSREGRQME